MRTNEIVCRNLAPILLFASLTTGCADDPMYHELNVTNRSDETVTFRVQIGMHQPLVRSYATAPGQTDTLYFFHDEEYLLHEGKETDSVLDDPDVGGNVRVQAWVWDAEDSTEISPTSFDWDPWITTERLDIELVWNGTELYPD